MAKYTKRPDGLYCTHVTIGRKEDGKPLRKTLYAKTIKELESKVAEVRRQVETGTLVTGSDTTVSQWAEEWLSTYKSNFELNTQYMYKNAVYTHIIPAIGLLSLKDVRPHHVQKIINNIVAESKLRTAKIVLITIKQIFKKAVDNNIVIKNPADSIDTPKQEKSKKRPLTDAEMKYFENADLDHKCRAFLYVLMYAGLRRGEALALTKNDINLTEETITVNKNLITVINQPELKPTPKTESGNRIIPIPEILVNVLKDYLLEVNALYIFPSAKGNLMSDTAYRRFWAKILRRVNIAAGGNNKFYVIAKDITAHTMRHTYATMLYYAGVDIKSAQYLLGHATAEMTLELYTHFEKSAVKPAIGKLNDFISSGDIGTNRITVKKISV